MIVDAEARAQRGAAGDQRVFGLEFGVQSLEQEALAQAEGREAQGLELQGLDQALQDERGIGDVFQPPLGDARHLFQRRQGLRGDEAGDAQGFARRHLELLDDFQRIELLLHPDQGQVAPGAADGVERLVAEAALAGFQFAADDLRHALGLQRLGGAQRERAERQGDAGTGGQVEQFQAGPAQVADHTRGVEMAAAHALGRIEGFLGAGQHAHDEARLAADLFDEGRTVLGFAHRGGGHDVQPVELIGFEDGLEAAQRNLRLAPAALVQHAGRLQVAAEARQHLFVEYRPDRPPLDAVDHQAYRVRADIDDSGGGVQRGHSGGVPPHKGGRSVAQHDSAAVPSYLAERAGEV